jgi:ligand-binding sensor domain-containing protein
VTPAAVSTGIPVPITANPKFVQISVGQGLSQSSVYSIHQDSEGFMWFGTEDGLNRYDGYSFRIYRREPDNPYSLSDNWISSIVEDHTGTLWIGSDGAGLTRFDPVDGTFTNYPLEDGGQGAGRSDVRAVFEDRYGRLWIGSEGGLTTFDRDTGRFQNPSGLPVLSTDLSSATVYAIDEDRDGVIWVGTWADGVFAIDPERGELQNYRQTSGNDRALSQNMVVSLMQDREGTLWIGTTIGGVNKLTIDNRTFTYYQHDPDDENSLSSDWVRSVFEDDAGYLWIGTGGGGLNRYHRETETWQRFVHDPADPNSLGADFLSRVSQDSRGTIWIATENGVDRFDPATETFAHFRDHATSSADVMDTNRTRNVYEDRTGRLWVARAGGGVAEMNPRDGTFTAFIHDPDNPNSLIYDKFWQINGDSRGDLWFSTSRGVDRFDPETETFTHFRADPSDPRSLSDHFAMGVWEDRSGTIWICSFGGGLNKFEPETGTFVHWTEKDELPNSVVYGIAFDDDDCLWISTNNGLSRFDPASETFTNFQLKDGLPIVEFNADVVTQARSGEVFFGGINGFVSFFPSSVRKNSFVPPIVITRFASGGKPMQIHDSADEITIRWPVNSFEFEYAALSYANPEYTEYAFMLEGLDDDWIRAGTSRVGGYDRLGGGSYTLRIRGSNDDGLWNESGTSLKITVVPPFWATWWFRTIAIAVILGAAAGLVGLRIRRMADRTRRLEEEVKVRTAAHEQEAAQRLAAEEALHRAEVEKAITEERSRLARELHDSVTQSLYSVTLFTEATRELAEAGKLDQVKHGLVRSGDTALQALKEMRLLVYELRPLALSETSLIEAIRHRLDAVEARSGVKTHMRIEGDAE